MEMSKMFDSSVVECSGAVRIKLHVHPGAKRNGINGLFGDAIKLDLQTPPVDGKANAALIKWFAKAANCPKGAIRLVSGETSRDKVLEIRGIDKAAATTFLEENIL